MRSGGLCVSLTADTLDDFFNSDLTEADCVELRLDSLKDSRQSFEARWDRLPVPAIATCRGMDRGGLFKGTIEDEYEILEGAARNGARYVDIDYRYAKPIGSAEVIASYHNFENTPANLSEIFDQVCGSAGHIAKIATQATSWADNRRLLGLLESAGRKSAIVVGMGDIGQITRLVGPSRGSFITFAAGSSLTAPGQLTAAEMRKTFRFQRIRRSTSLVGILGMPLGHSLSPVLHNRAFEAAGVDFAYVKLPAPNLGDFMDNARSLGLRGFSVTIPHKVAVVPYMERLEPAASNVGAVNTVSDRDGGWVGDNTDVYGISEALRTAGFDATDKTVVVMGKGGAARAAAAAMQNARSIRILTRQEIEGAGRMPCDLLVNATPVGMHPNSDISPVEGPLAAGAVFDMVYNPAVTKLAALARAQGKTVVSGTAMFLAQAARQFEIWTGLKAPGEIYEKELSFS